VNSFYEIWGLSLGLSCSFLFVEKWEVKKEEEEEEEK